MAQTLAQLQASRDALNELISSGVRGTRFQDRGVDYQSIDDMLKALAALDDQIGAVNSTNTRTSYAAFSKGI